MKHTRRHFQKLAQETRAQADDATDARTKHLLLSIPDAYDRLAELVEKPTAASG